MSVDSTTRRSGRATGTRMIPAALLVGVLSVAAVGCGGSSSDEKANEAYANSTCAAIGSWENQVKGIATNFSGVPSKATLQGKVTQAETATNKLATQLKAVPPPDTSEGKAAKQELDQFVAGATTTISTAKNTLAQIPANPSTAAVASAAAAIAPQVKSLTTTAQSTVKTLQDAGGSLASAFKSADSCEGLT